MQTQARVGDILATHNQWGSLMNTEGATLTVKEVSRKGNSLTAQFYGKGLPRKWVYSLMSLPLGSPNASILLTGVTLDADGRAVCSGRPGECGKPGHPNAPVTLRLAPGNGEPLRFGLVAKTDQSIRAMVNYVPFPIAGTDKSCRIEAVILEPAAGTVHLEAKGLPPGSPVTLNTEMNGKTAQKQLRTDAKGQATSTLVPNRGTDKKGSIRAQVTASSCSPAITIPWTLP